MKIVKNMLIYSNGKTKLGNVCLDPNIKHEISLNDYILLISKYNLFVRINILFAILYPDILCLNKFLLNLNQVFPQKYIHL